MAIFKTPTPDYQQQPGNGERVPARGIYGWLASLIRTPTPAYQTLPPSPPEAACKADEADAPPASK